MTWSVIGGVLDVTFREGGEHDMLLCGNLRTSGFKGEMWRLLLVLGLLMGMVDGIQRGGDIGVVRNGLRWAEIIGLGVMVLKLGLKLEGIGCGMNGRLDGCGYRNSRGGKVMGRLYSRMLVTDLEGMWVQTGRLGS